MKKLIIFLIVLAASQLKAQDKSSITSKSEYAFVYLHTDTSNYKDYLNIHYENGRDTAFTPMPWKNFKSKNVTKSYDLYIKAFHFLENQGYDLIGANPVYGEYNYPSYLFRKIKK